MSSANATRIFGIKVAVDPRFLIGGLVAIAAVLFWYNSRSEDVSAPSSVSSRPAPSAGTESTTTGTGTAKRAVPPRRSGQASSDRGVLRMRPVDATRGDIDPTLHLGLLSRLRAVDEGKVGRSVFEIGPAPQAADTAPIKAPQIPVGPVTPPPAVPTNVPPQVNVPFKYYGYVKPGETGEANRGLFLDESNNVVVAAEGQTIKGRYLVVELTQRQARVEDTQVRQSKDLPVMPVAQQ